VDQKRKNQTNNENIYSIMNSLIQTRIIGIVDNTLYIDGLYAGDNFYRSTITNDTKSDLINKGVKEFSSFIELDDYHSDIFWKEQNLE
jgi:hypothetical protein